MIDVEAVGVATTWRIGGSPDVVQVSPLPLAQIVMIAQLGQPERMPEPDTLDVLGLPLARLDVDPFAATAPAKLSRAIEVFDAAHNGRI